MKLAMTTLKKAMHRSTMSMGNFLFTDYKVHNVSYRRKYAFPNPVFKSQEKKEESLLIQRYIFIRFP